MTEAAKKIDAGQKTGESLAPLRVIHVPVSPTNPYQKLLLGALEAAGVSARKIMFSEIYGRFPLTRNRAEKCEVLHLHWLHAFYQAPALGRSFRLTLDFLRELWRLRRRGVKIVWTVHDRGSHDAPHPRLDRLVFKAITRLADRLIVHCAAARQWAIAELGAPPARIRVIPHGSFYGYYPDTVTREEARRELALPLEARVLLFFGSLRADKGLAELIAAFARIERSDCRLLVAGWVADQQQVELLKAAAARDSRLAIFPELVPDERVQYFLRAADVVVMPYQEILTSSVLMLARNFNRPVVAPALGCLPEQLGVWPGALYDPADPSGLSGALARVLREPLPAADEAIPAPEEPLQWSTIAASLLEVYREARQGNKSDAG